MAEEFRYEMELVMLIERMSPVTGIVNTKEIDATEEQLARWIGGELIQNVFPDMSPDDREFLVSGCTPEDWITMYTPRVISDDEDDDVIEE